jgi:hypothetical protein
MVCGLLGNPVTLSTVVVSLATLVHQYILLYCLLVSPGPAFPLVVVSYSTMIEKYLLSCYLLFNRPSIISTANILLYAIQPW